MRSVGELGEQRGHAVAGGRGHGDAVGEASADLAEVQARGRGGASAGGQCLGQADGHRGLADAAFDVGDGDQRTVRQRATDRCLRVT